MFGKNFWHFVVVLVLSAGTANAQRDSIQQRIFFVGDAGELHNNAHPVIDWLKKNVDWNDSTNKVVFLGDNIYEYGLPMEGAPGYEESKKVIDYQIGLVKGKRARAYIIPGNHDWMNGKQGGLQQSINQTNYINGLALPNVEAWPLDGCPGPVLVELDNKVVLVFGDSQWFLYVHDKPGPGSGCAAKTIDEFTTELNEIVASHPNQLLIYASHHPFITTGPHGGGYTWKDHIFPFRVISKNLYIPLPVLGSAYPVARGYFGNLQDINHPLYRNMITEIEKTLKKHSNPVVVAGHEHSLQFNVKDSIPYIVSGSAAKLTQLKNGPYNKFLHLNYGFSLIEVHQDGRVETKFYDINSKSLKDPIYTQELKTIVPVTAPAAFDTSCYSPMSLACPGLPPYVTLATDPDLKAGPVKEFFNGKNYRAEWTQPITVPVLDVASEAGGLRPVRQSGGSQYRVLTLEERKGKQWNLRLIERFPQNIIPSDLRTRLDVNMKEDAMSASYPFAALIVSELQKSAEILTPRRKLVFVPDDPRLSRFKNDFMNSLAILEEREPKGISKTIGTDELWERMQRDNNNTIDQKKVLRVRLLDNFVMDFNRNENQFTWATYDTGRNKIYYPIPQNPSQAFFVNEGVIPWLSKRILAIPEITGFKSNAKNLNAFNKTAYNFDHQYLNALTEEDWSNEIDSFLTRVDDNAIISAMYAQPFNIGKEGADDILTTLQDRRQHFKDEMMQYYNFISKSVNIAGSNQEERFLLTIQDNGFVNVLVNELGTKGKAAAKIYERNFDPAITKEINIYGLEANDSFVVTGASTAIKLRFIGGPGEDKFVNNSTDEKITVYDVTFEKNNLAGKTGFISMLSPDPAANIYNRRQFKHDYVLPGVAITYNDDDGILLRGALELFRNKFRKEPYDQRHSIEAKYAINTGSTQFRYDGEFTNVKGDLDLMVHAVVKEPKNVTNYFGLGNNTVFDQTKGISYYRTEYGMGNFAVAIRKNMQSWMNAEIGPLLQYYRVKQAHNEGKYVSDNNTGAASPSLFETKYFLGAEGRIIINSKNNQVIPTRGANMNVYARQLFGLNSDHNMPTQLGLDLSFFMSISQLKMLVVGTRFGTGHNFGDFDFPQAQYLSGIENLRGYRKDRFAGRTTFFNNTEVRIRIQQFRTYLFPGSWGILLFNDIGRVWADGERSTKWHDGYGGGLWLSPVHRFVITTTVAHSPEENLIPMVGFGFQF